MTNLDATDTITSVATDSPPTTGATTATAAAGTSGEPAAEGWPRHVPLVVPWQQTQRAGTSDDRRLREITVHLPPHIAQLTPAMTAATGSAVETAMREITALDRARGAQLDALGAMLLRTESVASSKIEHIAAKVEDYARALHGSRANASAMSMVAATAALGDLIAKVTAVGKIELPTVLAAHRELMVDDPTEREYAGRIRDMQNWIGGSDHSPRNASYIPPPPETVPAYLNDLLVFANRDDMPALLQAAVVHAQFESIHPFTDGNGRIGRGLINAVLRRRSATTAVVVPLASALVAHRERYFAAIEAYRAGDIEPLVQSFAEACSIAAAQSQTTAERLGQMPAQWRTQVGRVRTGGPVDILLQRLPTQPVVTAEDVGDVLKGSSTSSVYATIGRLRDAGVLRPLTDRTRDQIWGVADVLDELDDLGMRIEKAAR